MLRLTWRWFSPAYLVVILSAFLLGLLFMSPAGRPDTGLLPGVIWTYVAAVYSPILLVPFAFLSAFVEYVWFPVGESADGGWRATRKRMILGSVMATLLLVLWLAEVLPSLTVGTVIGSTSGFLVAPRGAGWWWLTVTTVAATGLLALYVLVVL